MTFLRFQSYDDLVVAAEEVATKARPEYRELVTAYYLLRLFTVELELITNSAPIQVWNEHRNSLDHLILSFCADKAEEGAQIKKATFHILRALGDIVELNCHKLSDQVDKKVSTYSKNLLSSVNNGKLIRLLEEQRHLANSLFASAKLNDVTRNTGSESGIHTEALKDYINSAFAYGKALSYFSEADSILSELSLHEEERAKWKAKNRINALVGSAGFAIGCGVLAGLFFETPWVSVITSAVALALAALVLTRQGV